MDLFRKITKKDTGESLSNNNNNGAGAGDNDRHSDNSQSDAMMKSIDDLVDSSEEAEIFDDDEDELETPSKSVASITSSSNRSPMSFKEVAKNLTGTTGSPFLSIPKTVQHGVMADLETSSKNSRHSLASSKSSSVARSDDLLSLDDDDDDDDEEDDRSRDRDEDDDEEDDDDDDDKGSDSAEDYTDDEDEGQDGYKPGGYHPVKVGEVYNQR